MKGKRILIILFCALLFAAVPAYPVLASGNGETEEGDASPGDNGMRFGTTSPWLSGTMDESIYKNVIDAKEDDQNISVKTPGLVEQYSAELLRNAASSLVALLQDTMGASLDSIVFGRVGSGSPNRVNIYAFELRKGNPYGVTASICYALMRGMMYIFLGIGFIFQLAKAAWSGQTARSRDEIKSMFPTMLFKFAAISLMPYLLDVALYVRDVLLYGVKEVTADMVSGGATLSLSESFLYNAERSGTFVDAVMYLGTVVLTIYFIFIYVSVAIDMLVCFVSFPFICVLHGKKKDLINEWVMTVFSNIMTPVIDAVLLLIPLLTSLMLSDVVEGVAVIQLVMCMLIIPARGRFKALLGMRSNERNGFLGAMAMMGLGRAIAGRIRQGAGKIADAVSDAKNSRMHKDLAEVDKEEEQSLLSDDASGRNDRAGENGDDLLKGGKAADEGDTESAGDGDADGLLSETSDRELGEAVHTGAGEESVPEGVSEGPATASSGEAFGTAGTGGERLRDIDNQVGASQGAPDGLREQKAGPAAQENAMGMRKTPTAFDERRAEILRKRANISNFEQPEFKGVLSNEQMRVLYRRRAIANGAKAVAGTAGAAAFGTAAGSAALFMGPSAVAIAAAGGLNAGGSVGEASVDVAAEAARTAGPAIRSAAGKAYRMADMAASAYVMNRVRPAAMQAEILYAGGARDATQVDLEPAAVQGFPAGSGASLEDIRPVQVAADANAALRRAMTGQGTIKSGSVLRAMQQANVELERQVAVMREEGGVQVTEETIRERRVSIQTDAVVNAILLQMENTFGYERGSEAYAEAETYVRQKVGSLLEGRDKPLV